MFSIFKSISPEMWYAASVSIISFAMGISFALLKLLKNTKNKKHTLFSNNGTDFTKLHTQVNEVLTEVRIQLDCARAYIAQFHNGGDFFSGESILKFSITHESCSLGVEQTIDQQQGVLLTRFIEKLKILQEDEARIIFTNTLTDSHFKGFMEARNTIAFVLVPLKKDTSLSPYGYICAEWCSWNHAEQINADFVLNFLKKDIRILNTLLIKH